jgi:hypothetical protein
LIDSQKATYASRHGRIEIEIRIRLARIHSTDKQNQRTKNLMHAAMLSVGDARLRFHLQQHCITTVVEETQNHPTHNLSFK